MATLTYVTTSGVITLDFSKFMPSPADVEAIFSDDTKELYPPMFKKLAPVIWALLFSEIKRDVANDAHCNAVVNVALTAVIQAAVAGGATVVDIVRSTESNAKLAVDHYADIKSMLAGAIPIGDRMLAQIVNERTDSVLQVMSELLDGIATSVKALGRRD